MKHCLLFKLKIVCFWLSKENPTKTRCSIYVCADPLNLLCKKKKPIKTESLSHERKVDSISVLNVIVYSLAAFFRHVSSSRLNGDVLNIFEWKGINYSPISFVKQRLLTKCTNFLKMISFFLYSNIKYCNDTFQKILIMYFTWFLISVRSIQWFLNWKLFFISFDYVPLS